MSAPFEALDAYLNGQMPESEAAAFEEQLFEGAASGQAHEAEFVDHLARLGTYLIPRCGFDIGSSRAQVDQLIAAGFRVQIIEPNPEDLRIEAIRDDVEIVATHIPIDVRGYDSVDVTTTKPDGTELKTFRDIGWDPNDGTVYAVCLAPLARISAKQRHVCSHVVGYRDGRAHTIARFDAMMAP
jgi:hypothetical protein